MRDFFWRNSLILSAWIMNWSCHNDKIGHGYCRLFPWMTKVHRSMGAYIARNTRYSLLHPDNDHSEWSNTGWCDGWMLRATGSMRPVFFRRPSLAVRPVPSIAVSGYKVNVRKKRARSEENDRFFTFTSARALCASTFWSPPICSASLP